MRDEIEKEFIRQEDDWEGDETGLLEVVKKVKPTVLIGTSTQAGAFTEEVVKEMAKGVDRPIIFPVRPAQVELPPQLTIVEQPHEIMRGAVSLQGKPSVGVLMIRPKDANEWTGGKALMATGSPFEPVHIPGKDKKYVIAECNNVSHALSTIILDKADDRL